MGDLQKYRNTKQERRSSVERIKMLYINAGMRNRKIKECGDAGHNGPQEHAPISAFWDSEEENCMYQNINFFNYVLVSAACELQVDCTGAA